MPKRKNEEIIGDEDNMYRAKVQKLSKTADGVKLEAHLLTGKYPQTSSARSNCPLTSLSFKVLRLSLDLWPVLVF